MESQAQNPPPPPSPWSQIVKQNPTQTTKKPQYPTQNFTIPTGDSTKGIKVAIVDANAIIQGAEGLTHIADKFVSVAQVINEVRDPTSRHRLATLPFNVDTMEPSPESIKKVISFARATGDLQTLSDVDLKLIALAYTLEAQIYGTQHLRDKPPPVHMLKLKRLPEDNMPGWGNNVPNLEEWEALEGKVENHANANSRILPLKDLNLNVSAEDKRSLEVGSVGNGIKNNTEVDDDDVPTEEKRSLERGSVGNGIQNNATVDGDACQSSRRPTIYYCKKRELKIEENKMMVSGIDASQGQYGDDACDFQPAVSRSTHRRYLRRKSRREMNEASLKCGEQKVVDDENTEENHIVDGISDEIKNTERSGDGEQISSILVQMKLEEDSSMAHEDEHEAIASSEKLDSPSAIYDSYSEGHLGNEEGNERVDNGELDHIETESQTSETVDTSFVEDDGDSSEQSWRLRSLSDSSVACITGDFAMQNVILQIGLRLLAPGGKQIRELHRWILKCHACLNVTSDIGRVFCPKCGNGGTLRKVAVTVGENGIVLAAGRPRIFLRGTRFSLPLPHGGRDAITKNPILREDQLPQKFLYQKTKKKSNTQDDDFFCTSSIFTHHTNKRPPHAPPVRQALAMLGGRRNPNDNHYSRTKHKR